MEDRIRKYQGDDQLELFPYGAPQPRWRYIPAIILAVVTAMIGFPILFQ